jgi:hypothetical protein
LLSSFILVLYGNNVFLSRLLYYLAVLGIDTETGRLRTAKNYLYILAGMVYCTRVLLLEYYFLLRSAKNKQRRTVTAFLKCVNSILLIDCIA